MNVATIAYVQCRLHVDGGCVSMLAYCPNEIRALALYTLGSIEFITSQSHGRCEQYFWIFQKRWHTPHGHTSSAPNDGHALVFPKCINLLNSSLQLRTVPTLIV